jgi:hypothetical protein
MLPPSACRILVDRRTSINAVFLQRLTRAPICAGRTRETISARHSASGGAVCGLPLKRHSWSSIQVCDCGVKRGQNNGPVLARWSQAHETVPHARYRRAPSRLERQRLRHVRERAHEPVCRSRGQEAKGSVFMHAGLFLTAETIVCRHLQCTAAETRCRPPVGRRPAT